MADLGALSVEPEERLGQEPQGTPAKAGEPAKSLRPTRPPRQVQSITLPSSDPAINTKIQKMLLSEVGPWDLAVGVGSDGFLISFDQDDPARATEASKHIVQKIDAALDSPCRSQLIDIRARDGALHQTVLATQGKAPKKAPAEWVPLESTSSKDKEANSSPKDTEPALAQDASQPAKYETGYAPMWNIRNEVLMGFAVLPIIRMDEGTDTYGHTVLGTSPTPSNLQALDTEMLRTQINTAAELLPKNFTSLLVSQIHFGTLSSSAGRKEILEIAQQIPPHMKGILMASIVGIPESTPASTLAQRLSGLSKYFRAVSITIPNSSFPVAACAATGATSVSYKIPDGPINERVLTEARKIIAAAKSARMLTVFEEVSDLKLAVALKKLGAVFITGECLGGIHEAPQNMKKLTVADVQSGPLAPLNHLTI